MIGVHDRQAIRERPPAQPQRPGASKSGAQPAQQAQQPAPPEPPGTQAQQPDPEQQRTDSQDNPEQPVIAAPEPTRGATGPFEFHTDKWEAAYIRRIDATIAALKSAGVPVLWVGLPAQRNARASSDSSYLNELFRSRAEKWGITYVDVWDGFVDEAGRFAAQGPDVEGQVRRLRSGDGVYFTKFGARKLAHYVEREIQRNISSHAIPVALPSEPGVPGPGPAARPGGGPAARPLAGPVMPLTTAASGGTGELLGGNAARPGGGADPTVTRVLTKGEPVAAPTGRADDFNWPRGAMATEAPAPTPVATTPAGASQPKQAASQGATAEAASGEAKPPVRKRPPQASPPRPPAAVGPRGFGPWGWR
jgi:hypothetical protein